MLKKEVNKEIVYNDIEKNDEIVEHEERNNCTI